MFKKLKKIFFLFMIFALFNNCAYSETLEFAQVSDIHYSHSNAGIERCLYFLSVTLPKKDPDFVVFLGDNIDKSNEKDTIRFMQSIHSLKMPYYITLGNHDAYTVSGIEKEVYQNVVTAFNKNQKSSSPYYYFKPNSDFIAVVLDASSNFFPSKHCEIPEEQLVWLDKLLTKHKNKIFLIFQHCPLVDPYEEKTRELRNKDEYKKLIDKHSNILLISSGHFHDDAVSQDENGVWHISAPAFIAGDHSYQLVTISYDKKDLRSKKNIKVEVKKVKV